MGDREDRPPEHAVRERWREAALEAEYETGEREETAERARAHIAIRLARLTGGSILLLAGLAMLALPGPGWLTVALGLGLLAQDVPWAERTLERVRKRLPAEEDGRVSRPLVWGSLGVAGVFTGASLWFAFVA
jgi:uncharacterized protein (TIGR02611 family)